MNLPKYTIRVYPSTRRGGDDTYAFGCPRVVLVDSEGVEVAQLKGLTGADLNVSDESFAEANLHFGIFEWESTKTILGRQAS